MGALVDPGRKVALVDDAHTPSRFATYRRVDSHHVSTSFLRFVEQAREEHRPRRNQQYFWPISGFDHIPPRPGLLPRATRTV